MDQMKALSFLMIAALLCLVGCSDDETLRLSIEKKLHASLSVGDSREKIERVLTENNMPFNFNKYDHRYETGGKPEEKRAIERVISVYIYVDGSNRLARVEVRNAYTGP